MRVLILDDNQELCHFLVVNLEENAIDAYGANASATALEHLKKEKFDVLVVDLQLKEEDGFGFIQKVRENRAGKNVPVILLSEHDTSLARRLAVDYGCNAFLSKPFTTTQLLDQLRRLA